MPEDEQDEDLDLAIALSLQQSPCATPDSSTSNAHVELTSADVENEDLRRAIQMSMQDHVQVADVADADQGNLASSGQGGMPLNEPARSQEASTTNAIPSGLSGLSGLDRKAMEQDRLARIGKRKRDLSLDQPRKQVASTAWAGPSQSICDSRSSSHEVLEFPKGVIRRTFAHKYPRTSDITIDELLQAASLHIAVISSFMWDAEWLHTKLDPRKIKQIWVMNAKGRDVQERWVREMKDSGVPNLKIHFPPMDGMIHSMHSKFMLLFGKDKLRIVIPTANMTRIDWGEVANDWQPGVMENSVFLIDLPRANEGHTGFKDNLSNFGRELIYFLEQQQIPQNVIEGVLKFDFSQTGRLAFVHSIGGVHDPAKDHPTGLAGLGQAIRELQYDKVRRIELEYAASSLGAINDTLLQRIYLAARGENFALHTRPEDVRDKIRIYFPTQRTVERSIGGTGCGGIITLSRQNYNAATFPKDCLRDYDSTRRGMLSHNKLLFARGCSEDGKAFGWVYVGSANLSESAWGGQKVLKSGKMGSLNIRNWECGVVVPVPEEGLAQVMVDARGIPSMDVYKGTIEVPFHHPGQEYGSREPWFISKSR